MYTIFSVDSSSKLLIKLKQIKEEHKVWVCAASGILSCANVAWKDQRKNKWNVIAQIPDIWRSVQGVWTNRTVYVVLRENITTWKYLYDKNVLQYASMSEYFDVLRVSNRKWGKFQILYVIDTRNLYYAAKFQNTKPRALWNVKMHDDIRTEKLPWTMIKHWISETRTLKEPNNTYLWFIAI